MSGCSIGIDFGTKNLGLAKSNLRCSLALPWCSLKADRLLSNTIDDLLKITSELRPAFYVVGLPLTMSGKDSLSTTRARAFADQLQKRVHPISVIFWDERLTSLENERLQINLGVKRKKRLQMTDSLAAATILQSYLDAQLAQEDLGAKREKPAQ